MKVFAEFFIEDGKEYRRTTLLQFGESIDLIGSAVLMNPGSAKAFGDPDEAFLSSFFSKTHNCEIDLSKWKAFSSDATMGRVEKIFNGWYIQNSSPIKLNGVIQLFNCFYYKDQEYSRALKNFDSNTNYRFNEYQYLKDKPVYLGWGGAGKNELKQIAFEIFSKIDKSINPIYDSDFNKNRFYHPSYINRAYKREKTQNLLIDFFQLLVP
ncbi:hypothetical protein [Flectobacillus longus]|uniref:hypothetical protein n=1 Tax=Flectobacillus longus TaxID=2984207 RepID=UPI0024B7CFDF|nr:hypothetical protein [Flectobacillus longus]MDI9882737.1 hypothetical protein [Flectobacillus longus]